jgi:hypothetical protein
VDFEYTPHEEAFRQELRTWLAANAYSVYPKDNKTERSKAMKFMFFVYPAFVVPGVLHE